MLCLGAPRLHQGDLEELDAEQFTKRFKVLSKLGQGGFANVLLVKDGQQQAALKVLRTGTSATITSALCKFSTAPAQAPEVALFREARALKHARHPNVAQLRSIMHIPKGCVSEGSTSKSKRASMGGCWGLLLELLQGGSLQQVVSKAMAQPHSSGYSYLDGLTWAVDIAAAVAHLHSLNPLIIHRDLKLENILLLKPTGPVGAGRKLPVAKLTDFGLHVMIDRPPAPFFITTGDDGMPLLILHDMPDDPKQHQQQQQIQDTMSAAAAAHGGHVTPEASTEDLTASNDSTPDAYVMADAEARVGPAAVARSAGSKTALASALKGKSQSFTHQQVQQKQQQVSDSRAKHVAFAASDTAVSCDIAADADAATAATADITRSQDQQQQQQAVQADVDPKSQTQSQPLPVLLRPSPPQAPQTWTRLTAGSLRRLSVDSCSMRSASHSTVGWRDPSGSTASGNENRVAIPLMLQGPAAGSSGSFLSAAVPAGALGPATLAGEADDERFDGTGLVVAGSPPGGNGVFLEGGAAPAEGLSGIGDGSISSMLAAANSCRDYEVTLQAATLHRTRSGPGSTTGASCTQSCFADRAGSRGGSPPLPGSPAAAGAAAAGSGAGGDDTEGSATPHGPASVSGMSVRSGEWPTAASMMWDDLMEDELEQELLLDGNVPAVGAGHSGVLIELPVSYNLTGHTGSFMYMAPEVYNRKPYNESVDIFSMGVMFYELFSRTLLIYTHTPANNPADCEHYASQIAQGFRPRRPKVVPAELWELIECCWEQDPADRPTAAEVLRKLQDILKTAESSPASKGSGGFSKLFSRPGANDSDSTPESSTGRAVRAAADQKAQAQKQQGATADVTAASGAASRLSKDPAQMGAGKVVGEVGPVPEPPQASCGCVIC